MAENIDLLGFLPYQARKMVFSFSPQKRETLLKFLILFINCVLAFSTRLFSVLRYESMIHEFDPYFNYRTTKFLSEHGYMEFHNWFDDRAWYPLGRIIGGTIYPGLMVTSALLHWMVNAINFNIDIREVCVFFAPMFSSATTIVTYLLTKELAASEGAGLMASTMIAIVPGYISRSVAGSYDNEGIAIFCMILTYYFWIKAVKTGSLFWSVLCSLAYFYMVSSWGGYVFLINLIPLHVLVLILSGRFSHKVYVAYSAVYSLGTILSMQIPFVGFQAVQSSEHMGALGVFGLCQLIAFATYLRSRMKEEEFNTLFRTFIVTAGGICLLALFLLTAIGKIAPWTGRFYSLLDPSYAKNHIPIIASVSEHQPTAWSSYFFDLQFLVLMFPVGLYYCFKNLNELNIFIIMYGVTALYFSGVMVRLMLVLAPVMCILGGIGSSTILVQYFTAYEKATKEDAALSAATSSSAKKKSGSSSFKMREVSTAVILIMCVFLVNYARHCVWVTSEAYSSPSIVMSARGHDGERILFDDYREAYYWLRMNTKEDAIIMSWWDYGYQITAIANRTVLVDNNTWNNTHISRVGQAMASPEEHSIGIIRELDVDYVLVIFGGMVGYSSDDINKFLWMVRIGGSTPPGAHIKERDYLSKDGEYRVDKEASETMKNCLMYKLCYYRFGDVRADGSRPGGFDRVRSVEIGKKDFKLEYLEEAFTSEHWIVRIYRVKKPFNRGAAKGV